MADSKEFTVEEAFAGARLDKVVAHYAQVSRKIARSLIATGKVQLGRRTVRVLAKEVRTGQRLVVADIPNETAPPDEEKPRLTIVSVDPYVLAVSKPSGLLSEPDRSGAPSVESLAPKLLREHGERKTDVKLVHRLDAGTSGVMLLARTKMAAKNLSHGFANAKMSKLYLALTEGVPTEGVLDAPIGRIEGTRHGVVGEGKPAQTLFEVVAQSDSFAWVRAFPKTGRTHQIRVHLAHLGCPILGDRLYGGSRYLSDDDTVPRTMLHARQIEFSHPKSGDRMCLRAEIPADFRRLADRLSIAPLDEEN